MSDAKGDVTYLGEVIEKAQYKIGTALTKSLKLLPGTRAKIVMPLQEAAALLKSVEEVLKRSGMDKRLGFMQSASGIQPVVAEAETEVADEA